MGIFNSKKKKQLENTKTAKVADEVTLQAEKSLKPTVNITVGTQVNAADAKAKANKRHDVNSTGGVCAYAYALGMP